MKIYVNDKDVTLSTFVNECVFESFSEDKADRIRVVFNDEKGNLSKLHINDGARFKVKDESLDSGTMFVKKAIPVNGKFEIIATSLPKSMTVKKYQEYKNTWYFQIMVEIARRNGLTIKNYGCDNFLYSTISQQNESDIAFANRISTYEGYKVIINNLTMIIYSPKYIESQAVNGTLKISKDGRFSYIDNRFKTCGSSIVSYENFSAKFIADGSNPLIVMKNIFVTSNAQALRYARGMLREENKNQLRGHAIVPLAKGIAGGTLINLTNEKTSMMDGKVFVSQVRHDLVNNQSKIFFRKPLGY